MHVSAVEMGLCTKLIIIIIIITIIIVIINCNNNSNNDIIPKVAREPIRIQSKPSLTQHVSLNEVAEYSEIAPNSVPFD